VTIRVHRTVLLTPPLLKSEKETKIDRNANKSETLLEAQKYLTHVIKTQVNKQNIINLFI
jgi:hypothetical protein